jgi:hypothetical protein
MARLPLAIAPNRPVFPEKNAIFPPEASNRGRPIDLCPLARLGYL